MAKQTTKQSGFTLIEITLAMAIFTFMLLIVSLAYINIARLYNASTVARNVQQNNRFAMEQMSRVARTSKSVSGSDTNICFASAAGSQTFYVSGEELRQVSGCSEPNPPSGGTVLTSGNAHVAKIAVDDSVAGTVTLTIWMVSKTDLLDQTTVAAGEPKCKSGAGAEFCAVNKLTTTLEMRGE